MENYIEHRIKQGMSPNEALESARTELHGCESTAHACREIIHRLSDKRRTFEEDLLMKGAFYERDISMRIHERMMGYISEWLGRDDNIKYC